MRITVKGKRSEYSKKERSEEEIEKLDQEIEQLK